MTNRRNFLWSLSYFCAMGTAIWWAISIDSVVDYKRLSAQVKRKSYHEFLEPIFYRQIDNQPELYFLAQKMKFHQLLTTFESVSGYFFQQLDSNKRWDFIADFGEFHSTKKLLILEDSIQAHVYSDDMSLRGKKISFERNRNLLKAYQQVHFQYKDRMNQQFVDITGEELTSWTDIKNVEVKGSVVGQIRRNRRYEGVADLKADQLFYNNAESVVNLNGNVWIKRGNFTSSAVSGEVYLENFNKKLKYYRLSDDIRLTQVLTSQGQGESAESNIRRAYGNYLEGYVKEGKVILKGTPRVVQGNDVIKGYQITLREEVDLVEIDDSQSTFDVKRKD